MPTISEAVKQDHALILEAYKRILLSPPEERRPDEFIWALDRYLVVEDLILSPAIEKHLPKGGDLRRQRLSDDYESVCHPLGPFALTYHQCTLHG